MYTFHYASPLGAITLVSDGVSLTGLWFDNRKPFRSCSLCESPSLVLPIFDDAVRWLDLYFSRQQPGFTPLLRLQGSGFQRMVWGILLNIPYGKTVSYGDIARRIAARMGIGKMSAQAVGGAVGRNPVSIIVPCHRVVGNNGSLTGYAGGIDRKAWLLAHEMAGNTGGKFTVE